MEEKAPGGTLERFESWTLPHSEESSASKATVLSCNRYQAVPPLLAAIPWCQSDTFRSVSIRKSAIIQKYMAVYKGIAVYQGRTIFLLRSVLLGDCACGAQ